MPKSPLDNFLNHQLARRQAEGLIRNLLTDKLPIDFFSNDYLGLARSQELALAINETHRELGVGNGSTGSRLLSGNHPFTEEVEASLSKIFKSEACLIFNSGYAANLAVLSAVPQKGDTILYDNLSHASLKDGARLSLATRHSFRHNELSDLEQKMRSAKGKVFVVVESIYSMDGDTCPLSEIMALVERYNAFVIMDEAHSTGVMGAGGAGFSVAHELHDKIDIRVYTFGKAMGVHGACVAGSRSLIRYLINFSRPFIYTTAPSPHQVVSIDCAFRFLATCTHLQDVLQKKIQLYLSSTRSLDNRTASDSAIQTLLCPGNENARQAAARLHHAGFDVRPILYPTVPRGTERLRICLHTFNHDEDIRSLTAMVKETI